jgi:hypothetical protein
MKEIKKWLAQIPAALSSTPSVFIFIFLFIYLFIFGLVGLFIKQIQPSSEMQLILGNYTNVLSALGAALAAGAGATHTKNLKELHKKHDKFQTSLDELHNKIDELAGTPKKK